MCLQRQTCNLVYHLIQLNINVKAENSRGSKKDELTQAYKSYADYAFPNNGTCHPHFENAADFVVCTPTNDECQCPNWK